MMPSLLTPTDALQYIDQDLPPHPEEMIFENSNNIDLEQELAYGLDGYGFH